MPSVGRCAAALGTTEAVAAISRPHAMKVRIGRESTLQVRPGANATTSAAYFGAERYDFAIIMCTPTLPSTSCVMRRSAAIDAAWYAWICVIPFVS